jgi:GntR family transcriptional regulator, transcriptional repressor for pyruvate dehydrogenase complex
VTDNKADRNGSRVPLTDVVSRHLEDLLREEGLTEGDSIPATGELASRFNVSRTVIREALAELTGRGLLRRQQGREGIVAVPGGDHLHKVFQSRIAAEDITFDQLQDLREVLEVGAARMAARHAALSDIARLSDLLHAMRTAVDDEAMLAVDVDFHRAVANAANPLFGLVLDGLSPLLMESRLAVWAAYTKHGGKVEVAINHHQALRDRIAERDEDGAAAAMHRDLNDTRHGLTEIHT